MKKQIKKLSLNKRTISNLSTPEMNSQVGGAPTQGNCATRQDYTCRNTCWDTCRHGPNPHC